MTWPRCFRSSGRRTLTARTEKLSPIGRRPPWRSQVIGSRHATRPATDGARNRNVDQIGQSLFDFVCARVRRNLNQADMYTQLDFSGQNNRSIRAVNHRRNHVVACSGEGRLLKYRLVLPAGHFPVLVCAGLQLRENPPAARSLMQLPPTKELRCCICSRFA